MTPTISLIVLLLIIGALHFNNVADYNSKDLKICYSFEEIKIIYKLRRNRINPVLKYTKKEDFRTYQQ